MQCDYCNAVFESSIMLNRHIGVVHHPTCSFCGCDHLHQYIRCESYVPQSEAEHIELWGPIVRQTPDLTEYTNGRAHARRPGIRLVRKSCAGLNVKPDWYAIEL